MGRKTFRIVCEKCLSMAENEDRKFDKAKDLSVRIVILKNMNFASRCSKANFLSILSKVSKERNGICDLYTQ